MLLSRQTPLPMCSMMTEILRYVHRNLLQIPYRRRTQLTNLQHMFLCVCVCAGEVCVCLCGDMLSHSDYLVECGFELLIFPPTWKMFFVFVMRFVRAILCKNETLRGVWIFRHKCAHTHTHTCVTVFHPLVGCYKRNANRFSNGDKNESLKHSLKSHHHYSEYIFVQMRWMKLKDNISNKFSCCVRSGQLSESANHLRCESNFNFVHAVFWEVPHCRALSLSISMDPVSSIRNDHTEL